MKIKDYNGFLKKVTLERIGFVEIFHKKRINVLLVLIIAHNVQYKFNKRDILTFS